MDRIVGLLGDATQGSRLLEIGPSHMPVAPKRAGWNTTVVDYTTADGLRAKYAELNVDTSGIEEVDFVWAGGRLEEAIPRERHGSFERMIASHVIEHIPDFVGFFRSASILLAPDGALALAVPDKRYCFDYFKPLSTTGDALEAFKPDGPGRHSRKTLFQQSAYSVAADGAHAWTQRPVHSTALIGSLEAAFAVAEMASDQADSPYIDAHAWHFIPSSFQLMILELGEAGLIDWHIADIHPVLHSEFIVVLRKGRKVWADKAARDARRLALLNATLVETQEQLAHAIEGGLLSRPMAAPEPVGLRETLQAQAGQLAAIRAMLEDIHPVARWVSRLLGPLVRLRGRLVGR